MGRVISDVCDCVSLCVRALKGKPIELSTPNLVNMQCMVVAQHALTVRSEGERSRSHIYQIVWVYDMDCLSFLVIDRVAGEIIRLVASVCVRVCPFAVGTLLNEPFDL